MSVNKFFNFSSAVLKNFKRKMTTLHNNLVKYIFDIINFIWFCQIVLRQ